GRDFVTVTKAENGDWDLVHRGAAQIIESHLKAGEPVLVGWEAEKPVNRASVLGGEIESRIRQILDAEIRPAVAMDGGDIAFDRFEDGVVYLQMKGSCSGCPSSTQTLKMGIETRLRALVPEVKEVVSA
ncbi:MAG TPA: NifU family protein, partial [Bdellovibrionota bacterium]|nr:NifU family protein [Bdellovibrionota bacterium]